MAAAAVAAKDDRTMQMEAHDCNQVNEDFAPCVDRDQRSGGRFLARCQAFDHGDDRGFRRRQPAPC